MLFARKGNDFRRLTVILGFGRKCLEEGIRLLRSFEGRNEVALFVIQGQVRKVLDPVKRWQPELFVAADLDIRVFVNLIVLVEFLHRLERHIGGHYNFDVLEILEIGENGLGLVLAMLAFGAEENDNRLTILMKVVFGQIGRAVQFKEAKGRDGREPHKRGAGVCRIAGGLVGERLGG
jgi:hypothetical protein